MGPDNRCLRRPLGGALTIIACVIVLAPVPALAAEVGPGGASDPLEGLNRKVFRLNQFLDRIVIRPAAMVYTHVVPSPIRKGLKHAIDNLGEPAIFVNDVLQGHAGEAARTVTRFVCNSTFGVAGLIDVAKGSGLPRHPNDVGMTLARYGIKAGPYLYAPVVGPTTLRDAVGGLAELAMNPLVYLRYHGDAAVGGASVIIDGLQTRADADRDLQAIYASATDPYASMRSYYLQNRQSDITGGKLDIQALPDFGDEPSAAAPATGPETPAPASPPTTPAPTQP